MHSSLQKHQPITAWNDEELLRKHKDLIVYQNKILIDLNLISPQHYEYERIYALHHYGIVLNKGKR